MENITFKTIYQGQLRTESTHTQSGQKIITDAPTDNQGKGEAFSPTDLTCTSLATCIITTMAIVAERNQVDLTGAEIQAKKIMASNPRRIAEIHIALHFLKNLNLSEEMKQKLEHAALHCPVKLSLHPDIVQKIEFLY